MIRARVLVYVQHLLGIGHLKRAATLARALAQRELEVTLVSGGFPVEGLAPEGVRWVQLPATGAADDTFQQLIDEKGRPIDERWKTRRRDALLEAWRSCAPHALVIELFPFGRRQMRFELLPLLDAVRAAPRRALVISSVRDVLGGGQRKPERQDEMLATLERYFDHVLVHGDPSLISFDRTFRHAGRISDRLRYTGYIVDGAPPTGADARAGRNEVIVSAGGGAVGQRLLETAIRARPRTALADRRWRVLAGTNVGARGFDALTTLGAAAGEGRVVVERARRDFTTLLANCALSISQCGYNTTMETLQAGARAVVVPFAGSNEIEQTLRARLLAERGLLEVLEEPALSPEALAAAVDRAVQRERPTAGAIDLGGAVRSAELIGRWIAERGA